MLTKETMDYIKDFLAYKAYVKGELDYTRMKFFEEVMDVLEEKYQIS